MQRQYIFHVLDTEVEPAAFYTISMKSWIVSYTENPTGEIQMNLSMGKNSFGVS